MIAKALLSEPRCLPHDVAAPHLCTRCGSFCCSFCFESPEGDAICGACEDRLRSQPPAETFSLAEVPPRDHWRFWLMLLAMGSTVWWSLLLVGLILLGDEALWSRIYFHGPPLGVPLALSAPLLTALGLGGLAFARAPLALRVPLLRRWALGVALATPFFVIGLARLFSRLHA